MIKILLILVLFFIPQEEPKLLYNKDGRPSTKGIKEFIDLNQERIISEYESRVDSLFEVFIYTEDLSYYSESELGAFYAPGEIVVTDREKFIEYEFNNLSNFKKKTISSRERTVKGVIFHELTHAYFYQTIWYLNRNGHITYPVYSSVTIIPNHEIVFGARFIEEGICEYMVYKLGEASPLTDFYIPRSKEFLLDSNHYTNNVYYYSVYFIRDFVDKYGLKKSIEILVNNVPPTYEEILTPSNYFSRLNIDKNN